MLQKTAVELFLDELAIPYQSIQFIRDQPNVPVRSEPTVSWEKVYKTLALTGKRTGPVIAVVPVQARMSYKKLAKVSGNRSVGMVDNEKLIATTGYEHGANNPVGIWRNKGYPIFFDEKARHQCQICVSSGEVGRAMLVDTLSLADLVHAQFSDLLES
ncbi:YbaK/EbsC family protein [Celerinatantimonas sp. MCCC 1A17872]|uniref:YbaK/EbsC family protein n=1 Tax=Celerinatantimonas sp. MCCC 1A17872 TaxID=3177514 RepID=UPI0038C88A9F